MSLWIKICGNTSFEDARLACEAGADAAGFVFAPSPRRVTVKQVAEIAPRLPPEFEKIGVFVDSRVDEIVLAVERAGLTGVQLYGGLGGDSPGRAAVLRGRFGRGLRILQVIHFGRPRAEEALAEVRAAAKGGLIDGVLVDSYTAAAVGGTGVVFDWQAARASPFAADLVGAGADNSRGGLRVIAAGGLNAANVAEAIHVLAPWGVDVVTGVEKMPGRKDAAKVRAFVVAARAATA